MKRIHITGCPRSGTTLMMELMRTCFQNNGFCDHEMSIFAKPAGNMDIFFSKQPSDIRRIKPLLHADPDLYVLNMVRDPRAVISSIHKNFPGMYFCNFRVWNECHQKALGLLTLQQFLQIRYEDLVTSPDKVQHTIESKFSFLTKKIKFSEYHGFATPSDDAQAAMGGVRKISTNRVTGWKQHLPRIKHEYKQHPEMAETLITLGYESDKSWLKQMDKITAQKGKCRYPDQPHKLKTLESTIRNGLKCVKYILTK